MRVLSTIVSLLLILFFNSCEEEVNAPIQETEPMLVVNSLIGTDSLIKIHLGKSSGFESVQTISDITDARVTVYQNDQILGDMIHQQDGEYHLPDSYLQANNTYKINISHQDYSPVSTESRSLEKVAIDNLEMTNNQENKKIDFTLRFKDNPLSSNYYMILLKEISNNNPQNFNILTYYSDDIVFNGNLSVNSIGLQQNTVRGSRSFSDEIFNGEDVELSFYLLSSDISSIYSHLQIELYHMTEEYYKYERSYVAIENRDDLPFLKKIKLFSNVNGGYGIFTTFAVDKKLVQLEK